MFNFVRTNGLVARSLKALMGKKTTFRRATSHLKLTSDKLKRQASRRDNMKPKEKRERKLKAWILKYIRNLKKLPKLPEPNKEGKIGIEWLQVEEDIYLTAKDQFYGVYGYGNDKDWNDGKMSWVFWYICDEVENLINKLKQQASEQKG